MNRALLDTDTVSELLKGRDLNIYRQAALYRETFGLFTVSVVTLLELARPLVEVGRADDVMRLVRLAEAEAVLAPDVEVVALASRIQADLKRHGEPVSWTEVVVAAQALRHGLDLVTGDPSRYEPVARLGHPLGLRNWKT